MDFAGRLVVSTHTPHTQKKPQRQRDPERESQRQRDCVCVSFSHTSDRAINRLND